VSSSMPNTSKFAVPGAGCEMMGHDPANDQVPAFACATRNDRLNIQHILNAIIRTNAKIAVVLNWNTDQAGHRVLNGLLE
jgi:hypothetical protein